MTLSAHCAQWNENDGNGILLLKLFWPTVRKCCSTDWVKIWKFKAEGQKFAKILRSIEQFIQTVRGSKQFLVSEYFFKLVSGGFSYLIN